MRIWFDTEFIDDGRTIDLISIGMIREDGQTFYAESEECDLSRASPWVQENVLPHLLGVRYPRRVIAEAIKVWVGTASPALWQACKPEFWAYYAAYDWVALCQLYGTMMQLPEGWPRFCMDIQQVLHPLGIIRLPTMKGTVHNALDDARWAREISFHLEGKQKAA